MIGYLGAVTILLSVVVPPFAQQAVFTFIDWENSPTGEALLSVCNDMNNTGPGWMSSLSNISNYDTPCKFCLHFLTGQMSNQVRIRYGNTFGHQRSNLQRYLW